MKKLITTLTVLFSIFLTSCSKDKNVEPDKIYDIRSDTYIIDGLYNYSVWYNREVVNADVYKYVLTVDKAKDLIIVKRNNELWLDGVHIKTSFETRIDTFDYKTTEYLSTIANKPYSAKGNNELSVVYLGKKGKTGYTLYHLRDAEKFGYVVNADRPK